MSQNREQLLSTFFRIQYLQLEEKNLEALYSLRSVIEKEPTSTIEHAIWTWLVTEQILRFNENALFREFNTFVSRSIELIEKNWNKSQSHLYLPLEENCFTLHLAIYYATLVNLRNLGYSDQVQKTATAIRDRVFEGHLKGGTVICSPDHPFASTDLLLSVLPFGLFSPEDLVMVEAVKEMEQDLVQQDKVLESPMSTEHSNFAAGLLSWYFLEKGDVAKSKHYRKFNKSLSQSASGYVEDIVFHYVSKVETGLHITHEPFGNHNKYEPTVYERFPRLPIEHEEVMIQFTAPHSSKVSAFVHVSTEATTKIVEAAYVSSEEKFYWKANIGGFSAHREVTYHIEWREEEKRITSNSYNFYPLEKVDIWNLVGCKHQNDSYIWWGKTGNNSLILAIDSSQKTMHVYKDTIVNENPTLIDINDFLSSQGLPTLFNDTYISPVRLLVDRFGNWVNLSIRFYSPLHERFFGMGERYHQLEYRGEELDCYVYNQYRDQGARTYMPVPFFISSLQYGLGVETSMYTRFDFGKTYDDLLDISIFQNIEEKTTIQFFTGSPRDIVGQFTNQTGPAELPPVWAFGPWMSSNNWDRDSVVREQVQKTAELQIPSTVLVLEQWSDEATYYVFNDAMYEPTEGSSALSYEDYTFPEWGRWPNPKGLVDYINEHGMEVILWQIPIVKYLNRQHHPQKDYDEAYFLKEQYFIKDKNNEPYRIPEGWFKESLLMDFSNSEGVKWWFDKRKYLLDIGVAGFKTDGGEMVFGDDIQFADQRTGSEMRNQYPNDYIKAYYEFAQAHRPNNAMTFSRAGYTGAQKYPAHWAGDERSTFDAFKRSLIAGLSSGLSGVIMWGWDLAGFNGDIPTAELFIRSAQMAAFCPIMQYHAESKAEFNQDRTPWNIAERTKDERAISGYRFYANVRMNLLPYIVEQAKHSCIKGIPLMRAMVLECPEDPKTYSMFDQYFFGEQLLVAPIIKESTEKRSVYLPSEKWVNLFSKRVFEGGQIIEVDAPLMEIPVFQRNNSCIITNVSKDNIALGSYIGNSTDSYTYPLIHITSDKSFTFEGYDHLNERWRVQVMDRENSVVLIELESNHDNFSISFTNTSTLTVSLHVNGINTELDVPPNNTILFNKGGMP
jgi:alpha-D-xyloside xylohydrolase